MKKVLLPTDFSENSLNAIKYAVQLFENEDCTFYLLNTYTPTVYYIEYVPVSTNPSGLSDVIKENNLKNLENIVEKIQSEYKNPKHHFEIIAAFNTLILEIQDLVQEKNIDYIVMGTKGATGAKKILFGSNTVHVLKNAKCPVLAIPGDFAFEKPHEILFPSDYGIDFQEKHVKPVFDIATSHGARVNVLNVSYGNELTEEQNKNKKKLEAYFKNIAYFFHSISNQNIPEAITKFQLKTRINLLVMINNKHSFFENLFFKSNINQIGFHLNIPFLVIPSKT
jgi:nucleotide-binding universal stress UspA family protein